MLNELHKQRVNTGDVKIIAKDNIALDSDVRLMVMMNAAAPKRTVTEEAAYKRDVAITVAIMTYSSGGRTMDVLRVRHQDIR